MIEGSAERAVHAALTHAAHLSAERAHAATERAAEASAQTARRAAAEHLCLYERRAADQRKRRHRLDEVVEVHVRLLDLRRGPSAALRRYYAGHGRFLPGVPQVFDLT
jgi:hypothetical protein